MIYNSIQKKVFLALCLIFAAISTFATPYMLVATASYFIFINGLFFIKTNRSIHALLMTTAIILDLVLVLVLELQRGAIDTLISFKLTPLNKIHIYASVLAVIFYFPVYYLGKKRLSNKSTEKNDKTHKLLGRMTIVLRTIGFIFMFSLLK